MKKKIICLFLSSFAILVTSLPNIFNKDIKGKQKADQKLYCSVIMAQNANPGWIGFSVIDENEELIYSPSHTFFGFAKDKNQQSINTNAFELDASKNSNNYDFYLHQDYVYCSNVDAQANIAYQNCISFDMSRKTVAGDIIKIKKDSIFPSTEYLSSLGEHGNVYYVKDDTYFEFDVNRNSRIVSDKEYAEAKIAATRSIWDFKVSNEYRANDQEKMKELAKTYLNDVLASTTIDSIDSLINLFNVEISKFKTDADLLEFENQRNQILNDLGKYFEINTNLYNQSYQNVISNLFDKVKNELGNVTDETYLFTTLDSLKSALKNISTLEEMDDLSLAKIEYCSLLDGFLNEDDRVKEVIATGKKHINECISINAVKGAYIECRYQLYLIK